MPEHLKLWKINEGRQLLPIQQGALNLESRLEEWIIEDPSVLDPELLMIGRQVETEYGGFIDILCLDRDANTVIVELKRDLTPREVTAQALDYASWVRHLSSEGLAEIANSYLGQRGPLEKAFATKFGLELPEAVNQSHSILVVASTIDASTERIIKYLSDEYGMLINAATFHYFKEGEQELLARLFLVEPEQAEGQARGKSGSKRRPNLTYEELAEVSNQKGVAELYNSIIPLLSKRLARHTTITSIAFTGDLDGSRRTVIGLLPTKSGESLGLYFQVYSQRLVRMLGVSEDQMRQALPPNHAPWRSYPAADEDHSGFDGYFRSLAEVEAFASMIESHLPA